MSPKCEEIALQDPGYSVAEFQERLRHSSPEQLEQCIRLLGMYLALYKRQFGELEESAYAGLMGQESDAVNLADLMAAGLDEANAMLLMTHVEPAEELAIAAASPIPGPLN